MEPFALPASPHFDQAIFTGSAMTAGTSWQTWIRPAGKARVSIFVLGAGGGGGNGFIGANSAAGGGGGGGSGGTTVVQFPLEFLPPRLYISVGHAKTGAGIASYVSTAPSTNAQFLIAIANAGNAGGNGSATSGGSAGSAGAVASNAAMPRGAAFVKLALAGQAGGPGSLSSPANVFLASTGIRVSGGAGGGGTPAAGQLASNGGSIQPSPASNIFPILPGGAAGSSNTDPAYPGENGIKIEQIGGFFFYGGSGGGSTHGSATGLGLRQGAGGSGQVGSGGGGSGGALTGSTAATLSKGGSGLVIINAY
jgi:hypothetical protein